MHKRQKRNTIEQRDAWIEERLKEMYIKRALSKSRPEYRFFPQQFQIPRKFCPYKVVSLFNRRANLYGHERFPQVSPVWAFSVGAYGMRVYADIPIPPPRHMDDWAPAHPLHRSPLHNYIFERRGTLEMRERFKAFRLRP